MNDEKVIQTKIETWMAAIIFSAIFLGIGILCKKWWDNLSEEQQEQFKKGCIKDFRVSCILTLIVVIVLIASDSFE